MDNKEKLEEAKRLYETANADQRYVLERLFPELQESEDEKTRKDVISFVVQAINAGYGIISKEREEKWITWLKKRCEQKYTAEEVLIKAGLKPYKDGDQWCVLLGDNIQEGICGFGNTIEDALYAFLKDLIASQGEQKPVWSEEDEVKINRIVACLENLNVADNDILLKDVDWLKSLRPQNTWKPSDEQMKALYDSIPENVMEISEREMLLNELYKDLKKL